MNLKPQNSVSDKGVVISNLLTRHAFKHSEDKVSRQCRNSAKSVKLFKILLKQRKGTCPKTKVMRHLSTFVRKRQNLLTTSKGLDKIHPNQFQSSISKFKTIRLFETWTGSVKTIQIFFKCTLLGISQNYHLVPASAHAKRTELNMMDRRWHSYLASALLF